MMMFARCILASGWLVCGECIEIMSDGDGS